jgi:hypothetical protein
MKNMNMARERVKKILKDLGVKSDSEVFAAVEWEVLEFGAELMSVKELRKFTEKCLDHVMVDRFGE